MPALWSIIVTIATKIIAFMIIKLTIRLAISVIVWAIYLALFVFAIDLIKDIYDTVQIFVTTFENTTNSSIFDLASSSGALKAFVDVLKIDIAFIFILLQYKLFIILRNLYSRGANEVDKTLNVV